MKKVKVEFTEKNLTGNAGLIHFGRFIKKLNLKKILHKHISISRAPNADYQVPDMVIMLIIGVLAGVKHMSHIAILRTDLVMRSLFGWENFPADSALGRIFRLFSHSSCNELSKAEDEIRRKVWKKKQFGRVTLDLDSSVRGVFGSQEGAEKGYNPKKKGQKSYHPLCCFIAETRECLHSWFRAGNTYSANGSAEFGKECFARLPKGVWKIFVRCDSAFFNGEFSDFLEDRGALYLVKAKMKGLNALLLEQKWRKARNRPGFDVTEFEYQCAEWKKPRHFIAVRQLIEIETDGDPEYEYRYFCYVTNDKTLTPWKGHKKYGKRATSENWIEWCKNQMAAGSILTQVFWANSAIFQTCILAYNLMVWMMLLTQGRRINEEPCTIRFRLIRVPAVFLTGRRELRLRLSKNFFYKNRWLKIEASIQASVFT